MNAHEVTTVVMARDGWPELEHSLPHHAGPVILIDNGSSDGTPRRVRRHFPHVQVVELGTNRGAPARNVGVQLARTELVAFADDDSWWEPGAYEVASACFRRYPRLGLLAGMLLVGADGHVDPMNELMAESALPRELDLPGPSVLGFLACAAIVRRRAFIESDGFDPVVFFFGEEERLALDMAARGWGLAYVDAVVARHLPMPAPEHEGRRVLAKRNELLTRVMRRPWPVVAGSAAAMLREREGRSAIRAALPRLPAALRRRRGIPKAVERSRRMLDQSLGALPANEPRANLTLVESSDAAGRTPAGRPS